MGLRSWWKNVVAEARAESREHYVVGWDAVSASGPYSVVIAKQRADGVIEVVDTVPVGADVVHAIETNDQATLAEHVAKWNEVYRDVAQQQETADRFEIHLDPQHPVPRSLADKVLAGDAMFMGINDAGKSVFTETADDTDSIKVTSAMTGQERVLRVSQDERKQSPSIREQIQENAAQTATEASMQYLEDEEIRRRVIRRNELRALTHRWGTLHPGEIPPLLNVLLEVVPGGAEAVEGVVENVSNTLTFLLEHRMLGKKCACGEPATWEYDPETMADGPVKVRTPYCPKHGPNSPSAIVPSESEGIDLGDAWARDVPEDDGGAIDQQEIDAVMLQAAAEAPDLYGMPVWYETDGRGGKRYKLPAFVSCTQQSHVDLPYLRGAQECGYKPVHRDGTWHDTLNNAPMAASDHQDLGVASFNSGIRVGDNPLPIPHEGMVHLAVITPGEQVMYRELSVPHDPSGKTPRSWRHRDQPIPF